MSGPRDRYHQSAKDRSAATVAQRRAQFATQRWTAMNTIVRAFTFRGSRMGTALGAAVVELAEANGLTWRNGRLVW